MMRIKSISFDLDAVMRRAEAGNVAALRKFGAFVYGTSRLKLSGKGGTSKPGRPPRSHTGLLRRLVRFFVDRDRQSVIIGPALGETKASRKARRTGPAPETLEYGGSISVTQFWDPISNRWEQAVTPESTRGKRTRAAVVEIESRPFMNPAFEEELPKVPKIWADSITS